MKTKEQIAIQRQHQKNWYNNNLEKVKEKKRQWYMANRETALKRNKEYVQNKKLKRQQEFIAKSSSLQVKPKQIIKYRGAYTLFEILDILRLDKNSHLNDLELPKWGVYDWAVFEDIKHKSKISA